MEKFDRRIFAFFQKRGSIDRMMLPEFVAAMRAGVVIVIIAAVAIDRAVAFGAIEIGDAVAAADGFELLIGELDALLLCSRQNLFVALARFEFGDLVFG